MKKIKYLLLGLTALLILYSCKKDEQTDYKRFLNNQEIVYTGAVKNVIVQPGNLEMGLKWKVGSDATIVKYVVYYNNKADSQVVAATEAKNDTIRTVIKGLSEYNYSFTIYSFDAKGNKSLATEINNAPVYGPVYQAGLNNRPVNNTDPFSLNDDGSLTLNFGTPDTINTKTVISYFNNSGSVSKAVILASQNTITLKDYKFGTDVSYLSYYLPTRTALDTFAVTSLATFPLPQTVKCDKSLFKEIALPGDNTGLPNQGMEHLWDGSEGPQSPPNVYFSMTSPHDNPNTFTIDLGKVYKKLSRVDETGSVIPPLNVTEFEVWGTADITNAATTLAANDPGWENEAKAKGWVLLGNCMRTDDGMSEKSFNFIASPPPVRYVRIRVKKEGLASNSWVMGELTFWNSN
ncbi:uncharacterized protein DUF5000 [Mucilaginibacter oryzae]|uniref:Uncharacterized protein DUF5000 n=1 Tax=Mucilaginibacter oryzae TaxID=468058 RepID=A0A316H7I3_9SPHI|nr:DUF4998 domain-containing protein [Mucilaginibacter oryzae]PWK77109.1 uncharacterized protein DUF5000 [Mucilaginibacter oryzae]